MSTDSLIARMKAMKDDAWETFLHDYEDHLKRDIGMSLRKRSMTPDSVQDILQQTLVVGIEKIAEFEGDDPDMLYRWLRVIAYYQVLNYFREWSRTSSLSDKDAGLADETSALDRHFLEELLDNTVEKAVIIRQDLQEIWRIVQTFSYRDQKILFRRYVYGQTPQEIAALYRLNRRSVSQQLSRLKHTLRNTYKLANG